MIPLSIVASLFLGYKSLRFTDTGVIAFLIAFLSFFSSWFYGKQPWVIGLIYGTGIIIFTFWAASTHQIISGIEAGTVHTWNATYSEAFESLLAYLFSFGGAYFAPWVKKHLIPSKAKQI